MIYLDNAATTKMFEKGADIYKEYACHSFFNPSANYSQAIAIAKELDGARGALLDKLGASKGQMIFTSGATESNNLAIMGGRRNGKWEYVFSMGEHPSVYNAAKELERQGFIVHFVGLQPNGQIDYRQLESVVNEKTRLISVMHVSNETGAINDLTLVNKIRKQHCPKALLHIDGVQAFCKLDFSVDDFSADFYTISAHKFHGPKGVGALYVRNINDIKPIVFGGGQEGGYRSGTENVGGIMAMKYAVESIDICKNFEKVCKLKEIMTAILSQNNAISIINDGNFSPYILSVSFAGVNGETLMRKLQDNGVVVGMGSACSAKKSGNRILESMGKVKEEIKSHIRISFNEFLSEHEVENAGKIILQTYQELWEKVK